MSAYDPLRIFVICRGTDILDGTKVDIDAAGVDMHAFVLECSPYCYRFPRRKTPEQRREEIIDCLKDE